MLMVLLYAVLVLSVAAVVGVAVATYVRIRRKVGAIPIEEPSSGENVEVSQD